jgi:hypothetical protein
MMSEGYSTVDALEGKFVLDILHQPYPLGLLIFL